MNLKETCGFEFDVLVEDHAAVDVLEKLAVGLAPALGNVDHHLERFGASFHLCRSESNGLEAISIGCLHLRRIDVCITQL